jgi:hypothetical protein
MPESEDNETRRDISSGINTKITMMARIKMRHAFL